VDFLTRPDPIPGIYDDQFWEYVRRRDIRLQSCRACRKFRFPPGPACPTCLSPDADWTPISGTGRLLSWAVFHRQYFSTLAVPYTVCAVETEEGPILVANLVESAGRPLRLDAPMHLDYEDARSADGKAWVIYQWALS
jgi:uncharacterized protein